MKVLKDAIEKGDIQRDPHIPPPETYMPWGFFPRDFRIDLTHVKVMFERLGQKEDFNPVELVKAILVYCQPLDALGLGALRWADEKQTSVHTLSAEVAAQQIREDRGLTRTDLAHLGAEIRWAVEGLEELFNSFPDFVANSRLLWAIGYSAAKVLGIRVHHVVGPSPPVRCVLSGQRIPSAAPCFALDFCLVPQGGAAVEFYTAYFRRLDVYPRPPPPSFDMDTMDVEVPPQVHRPPPVKSYASQSSSSQPVQRRPSQGGKKPTPPPPQVEPKGMQELGFRSSNGVKKSVKLPLRSSVSDVPPPSPPTRGKLTLAKSETAPIWGVVPPEWGLSKDMVLNIDLPWLSMLRSAMASPPTDLDTALLSVLAGSEENLITSIGNARQAFPKLGKEWPVALAAVISQFIEPMPPIDPLPEPDSESENPFASDNDDKPQGKESLYSGRRLVPLKTLGKVKGMFGKVFSLAARKTTQQQRETHAITADKSMTPEQMAVVRVLFADLSSSSV